MRYLKYIQNGCHTLIMALLADRPTISPLDPHKFTSFSDFTRDVLVPSSLHVLHMRMASVEHVVFLLLNAIKLQISHLFFSLHLHSQLHSHGSSFVTKNSLQRQLSWLSSCLGNISLSSLHPVTQAALPSIKQAP